MTIDFTKLLGFDTVSHELSAGLDLRDEPLAASLGRKSEEGRKALVHRWLSISKTTLWEPGSARRSVTNQVVRPPKRSMLD